MSHPAATNNEPLVQSVEGESTILGKPVLETSRAPDIGAAKFPIAFGDVEQGYAMGEHRRPGILRDLTGRSLPPLLRPRPPRRLPVERAGDLCSRVTTANQSAPAAGALLSRVTPAAGGRLKIG